MRETISDKRWRLTLNEIMEARNINFKNNIAPKQLDCEFCDDLKNEEFAFAWSNFKIYSGLEDKWIKESGLKKCKKQEATCLLFIGDKSENGYYINGSYKHFWLKSVQ